MGEGTIRVLKVAAIVMAVLIVLGTTTLFVMLAKRGMAPEGARPVATRDMSLAQIASVLDEPSGTRIMGIAAVQDVLAVQLSGGGADRIVLLDPQSGRIAGRIALAR